MADPVRKIEPLPDLMDFAGERLYFDEVSDARVGMLLAKAGQAEQAALRLSFLEQADALAPDDLMVIVALYRFYYFTHDYEPCLVMADRAMQAAARRLNMPGDWRLLNAEDVIRAASQSMPMLRFYLWALKGRGFLLMRLERFEEAVPPLETLVALDVHERLNARPLLELARERLT